MKLADIKVGEIVGVKDAPTSSYGDPRPAEVLGIVMVETTQHNRYTYERTIVKKKMVSVKFMTEPITKNGYAQAIDRASKGLTLNIESRQVVAPWAQLHGAMQERIDRQQKEDSAKKVVEDRLKKLLGKKELEGYVSHRHDGPTYDLRGKELEKLLSLAEIGKGA